MCVTDPFAFQQMMKELLKYSLVKRLVEDRTLSIHRLVQAVQMEIFSIGQVARRAGVGVETVRFYEREGLLEEPARKASGYRQYAEEAIKQIRFIKRAQQPGFSLKEIAELLTLRVDGQTECSQVKERAAAKLAEVEQKMIALQRMRQALLQVASLCDREGPKSRCPMLDALEHDSEAGEM